MVYEQGWFNKCNEKFWFKKKQIVIILDDKTTYHQRNREKIFNSSKNIIKIIKKDCKNKQEINTDNYLVKKKNILREYRRNNYQNMPNEDKEKLKEYQK